MKIFLICPVRIATDKEKIKLLDYVAMLETEGNSVYYPARDTCQVDKTGGFQICFDNRKAITEADEIHVFWSPESRGTLFDLGMAFALRKPLVLANPEDIIPEEGKSFLNMVCYWSFLEEEDL